MRIFLNPIFCREVVPIFWAKKYPVVSPRIFPIKAAISTYEILKYPWAANAPAAARMLLDGRGSNNAARKEIRNNPTYLYRRRNVRNVLRINSISKEMVMLQKGTP